MDNRELIELEREERYIEMCDQRQARIDTFADGLFNDEGTWLEFINNYACDPTYQVSVTLAFQNLRLHEPDSFFNTMQKAFQDWCHEQAESIAEMKGW